MDACRDDVMMKTIFLQCG